MKCEVKFVVLKMLANMIGSFQSSAELSCLQRYVRPKGPKAFICRTFYRTIGKSDIWIISNRESLYSETDVKSPSLIVNTRSLTNCNYVHTMRGSFLKVTVELVKKIVVYGQNAHGLRFSEMAADFIKD